MTVFALFLGEKAERYIELRQSLGYSFSKQAGTLRAFVRYVERAQLDAPATRTMALDFVLSFGGAANSRATRHGVLSRFYEYLAVYDAQTETLERRVFPRSRAIPEAFFLSSRGNRLSATGLKNGFAEVRKFAGLDDGKPLRPHDLRHRFAVTRLSLWHQQRANVQALLPLLATYLGHASYSDTAYYLTGSVDLLAMAAERAFLDGGAA
ncbi:hypothetical protein CN138_37270 [Sinorhizobium meliloti]|uniref:tyrosine-type recombinase/integrase n=1 Tax=Rhizobium meliloti TaxID=382 RepID=UPI000FD3571D|nr:tyrosine-type recombinase/integrase [Sinorhizobium meliloti]QGJ76684.1 hypothetical protein C3L21_22260 [Sinorhizobium meliloti]QND29859.1 tyrosine-type recombinase/integrase [Sinorhizobium meliloti]QQF06548.1 tyrosine-type recombinase/integrase [Sinorhizobium meliloti]RVK03573.1 hypothetical protein CN164_33410 [Sinorhizobium meliloti]RVL37184.1 hypothetical protein CN145_37335 [Sinorhizobium meliloti]